MHDQQELISYHKFCKLFKAWNRFYSLCIFLSWGVVYECHDNHLINFWPFTKLLRGFFSHCLTILYSSCVHIPFTGFQLISIHFEAHLSHNICFLCTLVHERPYYQSISMLKKTFHASFTKKMGSSLKIFENSKFWPSTTFNVKKCNLKFFLAYFEDHI